MTRSGNRDRQTRERQTPVRLTADERMLVARINEQTRRGASNRPPRFLFTLGIY